MADSPGSLQVTPASLAADCGKDDWLLSGRATTAFYVWLVGQGIRQRDVVLPVNTCYSLVHAVTLSGNRPRFIDVDPDDGNVRFDTLGEVWKFQPAAFVVVHNLGNPCQDLPDIADACRRHGVPLVEDCAAALGGDFQGRAVGATGDVALFSFGAGKTVDAGLGGMLLSRDRLDEPRQVNDALPFFNERLREKTELFSGFYRLAYYGSFYDEIVAKLHALLEFFAEIYLFRLRTEEIQSVVDAVAGLPGVIRARRDRETYLDREFERLPDAKRYVWNDGALPWRYNLLFDDPDARKKVIEALLREGVRVSCWYPPIHRLFGQVGEFPGASRFARRILNLPLDVDSKSAKQMVDVVRSAMGVERS